MLITRDNTGYPYKIIELIITSCKVSFIILHVSMQTSGIPHLSYRTATILDCCISCGHSCSSLQKWHRSDSVSDLVTVCVQAYIIHIKIHGAMNSVSMHVCITCF